MIRPVVYVILGTVFLSACASNADPDLVPDSPVRIAPAPGVVKYGDCVEARRRAAAQPDLDVDRLAAPRAMTPAPIASKEMPAAVRTAKYNEVRVAVLVDTLGRADMRTFAVEKATHPWLAASVKSAVAKWRFTPAELAGCKVARLYKWGATSGKAPGKRKA